MNKTVRLLTYIYTLIICLSVLLSSCDSCETGYVNIHDAPVSIAPGVTLRYPRDLNLLERGLVLQAAGIQYAEFAQEWDGVSFVPVEVYLFRGGSIPCGELNGQFRGCHYGPHGPIHLIIGDRYELPAFYHELIHHVLDDGDNNHSDTRWNTWWRPRQQEINNMIRDMRD